MYIKHINFSFAYLIIIYWFLLDKYADILQNMLLPQDAGNWPKASSKG